jgi:ATP-binding cassette, subfamily C, bacterial
MRSQVRQAFGSLWIYRRMATASIFLQMASVAAESLAVLALGRLFALSLTDSGNDEISGVIALPDKILSSLALDLNINTIFLFILVSLLTKGILQSAAIYIANVIWTGFQKKYFSDLARAYGSADWNFLAQRSSSTMLNLMFSEVSRAASTLNSLLTQVTAILSAAVYIAFAFLVSPIAVGLFALSFVVLILVLAPLLKLIRNLAGELIGVRSKFTQRVEELMSGTKVVKALGSEQRVQEQINHEAVLMRRLILRMGFVRELTSTTDLGIIVAVSVLFMLHLTGIEQALNAGVIGVILLRMSQRTQAAVAMMGPVAEGLPSLESTTSTLATLLDNKERDGETVPNEKLSSLGFEGVYYGYVDGNDVLKDINFKITSGEFIGIVGGSGAGKTTVVDLILGLLDPTRGRVVIDDLDLGELQRVTWRQRLGYVPQDVTLFHDTVFNNISAYRPGVTGEDVQWAANIAQASEFIDSFENGYDHIVGDRGVRLSGGQRQRLALARALATRPSFLLLDEATSSLDGLAENEFQTALENIRSQMTIIAIAHRIPTVMRADRVIVLSEGAIVEIGPPSELLKDIEGQFAQLYTVQSNAGTNVRASQEIDSRIDESNGQ